MTLSPSFAFSQSSLSAYAACPRRFQLRHVSGQAWPAVQEVLERERMLDLARRFHHLVQQHVSGLSADPLTRAAQEEDADLARWWGNYLAHPVPGLPTDRRAEVVLSMPMGAHRLLAKYDLLALDPARAVIVDWKTAPRPPGREDLLRRLQTRVYRYLLVEAGATLVGRPFAPGQVTMVYWFAERPAHPQILPYDAAQHAEDGRTLSGMIAEIEAETAFPMTAEETRCRFCAYRSLCVRGGGGGTGEEVDLEEDEGIEPEKEEDVA
ncbi:MAG: PD-(D/E)XK nuclease family protein [Candidatus Latescibacteria bacterium]|nr:PD-(D/E)XK nuclease family protein [Candidatus Latescibacterota bacterium]